MTVRAHALPVPWQARYAAGANSGVADTIKAGVGGSAGCRPHELLEAALATCMTITARMELRERGVDDAGVAVTVTLEREPMTSRFHYSLELPVALEPQRAAIAARLERSPVRTTLSRALTFEPDAPS
ncbi:MAG: OsmC family protein [Actinomycetia bacterium]|nr:OsmC family protein [Actinomycetes bacterium]